MRRGACSLIMQSASLRSYSPWKAFMGKHIHSISSLQVHVKGRLPTDDAERFFEELRRSRRRTCSIAIIRSVNEAP